MESLVRQATTADLDSLVKIFRACWLTSYKDILPESVRDEMSVEKAHQMWAHSVAPHAARTTFVIELAGQVVGVTRVGSDESNSMRGHLFSLYVHPDNAGRGLGKILLKHALASLREIGFEEITLWVFKNNAPTRHLYRSLGFQETGQERIDDRWKNPEIEMLAPSKLF
ncbi:MAG: GNAT family N-acetyltransferase [Candidatus Planktophila sp.]|nr:GNAT family N-acetyltransferase [Candidatus Planktophila sp.]